MVEVMAGQKGKAGGGSSGGGGVSCDRRGGRWSGKRRWKKPHGR